MRQKLNEKLLSILISRAALFFLLLSLITLFLYGVGTAQGFTDSTQFAFIQLYVALGIFLGVISLCGLFVEVGRFITSKEVRYLFRAGGYIVLIAFAIVTSFGALFILAIAEGNI